MSIQVTFDAYNESQFLKNPPIPCNIIGIYDNGGETLDRYTIYLDSMATKTFHDCLCLSDNPTHPLGFSQFSCGQLGKHNGQKISWYSLPTNLREHILSRIT